MLRYIGYICIFLIFTNTNGELPRISSNRPIVFDTKIKASIAEGDAEFEQGDMLLCADKIYFFSEEAKMLANGNVSLTNKTIRIVAANGSYILNNKVLETGKFRVSVEGHIIEGERLSGPIEELRAEKIRLYCNSVSPVSPNICARSGVLHKNENFVLRDAVFKIGAVPVFFSPYYKHDFKESTIRWKSDTSIIKRSKEFGCYSRNDVLVNLGWPIKPGFMIDKYRKRGMLYGLLLEYNKSNASGSFKYARINDDWSYYLSDTNGRPLPHTRFFFDLKHQQNIGKSIDFVSQVKWLSDSQSVKDFRPNQYDGTNQHPDTFAEAAYRGEDSVTSTIVRFKPNNFQRIQERLPEIKFDYTPSKIKNTPFYYQYGLGLAYLKESPIINSPDQTRKKSRRTDLSAGIYAPINIGDACTFTPVAGGRINNYSQLSGDKSAYTRFLGQIGFDVRFKAYGEYNLENKYWEINKIRHLIQPVVQYRFMPNTKTGQAHIPQIDKTPSSAKPSLDEIDLLNMRGIDYLEEMHLIRVGLENYFYTNYESGHPKQWLRFNFYQDFRLKRKQNEFVMSDTFVAAELAPSSFFSTSTCGRIDSTNKQLKELNSSISFHENDLWTVSLSHTYTMNTSNQVALSFKYKLNTRYSFSTSISTDAHKPDLISQTYTLSSVISNAWNIDYQFKWNKRSLSDVLAEKESWEVKIIITLMSF